MPSRSLMGSMTMKTGISLYTFCASMTMLLALRWLTYSKNKFMYVNVGFG